MAEDRAVLAGKIRELIDALVLADAGTADLAGAAEQVEKATAALRPHGRDSPLLVTQLADGMWLSINNPVEGPGNPLAPPVRWTYLGEDAVRARVDFAAAHEGPPGRVHGGWAAAVLDHVVGRAVAAAGFPSMTASLTLDYHAGTPYGVPVDAEGSLVRREGRKVHATGRLLADGQATVTATAILVTFDTSGITPAVG
ncbi:PaaI family thioesterase [Amycolatopsis acidicola]|nr:PaaI family thioesterase [Amycolatopsis acidicola]